MDKRQWDRSVEFHGHECPGLAIGFKACEAAREKLGINFSADEEIVCVTETDACGVDAIQVLTGCSLGKGNLIYRDTGKQAFTFFNRQTNESLRIILKPLQTEMDRQQYQDYLLNAAVDEIFEFKSPTFELPEKARLFPTILCEQCGEGAPEHKIRISQGRKLCLDCFENYTRGW